MSQYFNVTQTSCPICNGKFQKWTRPARCAGPCGRLVCPRHVDKIPYLCPDCKAAQAPYFSKPTSMEPSHDAVGVDGMIQRASVLYQGKRTAEADRLLDDIFVSIFQKNT